MAEWLTSAARKPPLVLRQGRAEFQSKLVAPWLRLARQPAGSEFDRPLLLDYLSEFQPYSLFHAVRIKDFVVAATSAISILIKILIIVSTGVITLSWTAVTYDSYPLLIQDSIMRHNSGISAGSSIAWYLMMGIAEQNLTYPEGMSRDYAFQSVRAASLPDAAEIQYTAEGVRNTLHCSSADVTVTGAAPATRRHPEQSLNLTVSSPDCHLGLVRLKGPVPHGTVGWNQANASTCSPACGKSESISFARFSTTVQCDNAEGDAGKRVFVMFGNLSYTWDYTQNLRDYTGGGRRPNYYGVLHRSTQLLCVPTITSGQVHVVRNGTDIKSVVGLVGAFTKTLDYVNAWDVFEAHFGSIGKTVGRFTVGGDPSNPTIRPLPLRIGNI
ncbi:hypothetical protein B0T16DRAFT_462543 [Cercophora newfieldiana]|uniref:Uncharacterized protein n=1 Tax=Cercophora newfieldiana TaxID=92897 RepID=A0AA39XRD2_9PEZI|nr:hypothetical protein B0T16DRAFT_462543 [Cercophora newfieldiana]